MRVSNNVMCWYVLLCVFAICAHSRCCIGFLSFNQACLLAVGITAGVLFPAGFASMFARCGGVAYCCRRFFPDPKGDP